MNPLAVTFPFAWLLCAVAAQGPPALHQVPSRARCGAAVTESGIVGVGAAYKARFGRDGVSFTAAFGASAPENRPLHYALTAIARSDLATPVEPAEPVLAVAPDGTNVVTFARSACTERYEVRACGLAQSFVLTTLPAGTGDLVMSAKVTTRLAHPASGNWPDGLSFEWQGFGAVTLSGVEAIDAHGRRCRGTMRWHEGGLDYVIPAAFTAAATLPLVVDPLLSSYTPVFGPTAYQDCDVDYERSYDAHLLVYEVAYSAVDFDVYGERLVARQFVPGLVLIDVSGTIARHPRVAGLGDRGWFLVVFAQTDDICVRPVSAIGALAPIVPITTSLEVDQAPDIGVDGNGYQALLVWRSADRLGRAPLNLAVPSAPSMYFRSYSVGAGHLGVAISKRTVGNRWLVLTELAGPFHTIHASPMLVGPTGLLYGYTLISDPAADCRNPTVDGDGTRFLCAWDQPEGPGLFNRDVRGRFVHVTQNGGLVPEASAPLAAAPFEHERNASVAWMGGSYLVGWSRRDFSNQQYWDVMSFDGFTCLPCEARHTFMGDGRVVVSGTVLVPDRNLIVWTNNAAAPSSAMRLAVHGWRADHGIVADMIGGCGQGGRLHAPCARAGNAWFSLQLDQAAPQTFGLLVFSFARNSTSCGSCTMVPDLGSAIIGSAGLTNQYGRDSYGIALPGGAAWVGARFYTQWALLGTACNSVLELSNALAITTQ